MGNLTLGYISNVGILPEVIILSNFTQGNLALGNISQCSWTLGSINMGNNTESFYPGYFDSGFSQCSRTLSTRPYSSRENLGATKE